MALVALIVFAMASVMPWAENVWAYIWPEGSGAVAQRGGRTHHILVLDGSLSMNLMSDGKTLFDRDRQMAIDKVKESPQGDGFSVLLMKDNPVWIVGEASHDGRKVIREIEQVRASHGNGSVPSMLNMVAAKVSEGASRFPVQNVYFFTDLQRSTWDVTPPGRFGSIARMAPKRRTSPPTWRSAKKRAPFLSIWAGTMPATWPSWTCT